MARLTETLEACFAGEPEAHFVAEEQLLFPAFEARHGRSETLVVLIQQHELCLAGVAA